MKMVKSDRNWMEGDALEQVLEGMRKHELESVSKKIHCVLRSKFPSVREKKRSRRPKALSRVMCVSDLKSFFLSVENDDWLRVLALQYVFGLRASEVSNLSFSDGLLFVYAPKTRRHDVIPVPAEALWLVRGCESISYHPSAVSRLFRKVRSRAGLVRSWGSRRVDGASLYQYSNHSLRHSGIHSFKNAVRGDLWRLSTYSRHDLPSRFGALGHYAGSYELDVFRDDMSASFGPFCLWLERVSRR